MLIFSILCNFLIKRSVKITFPTAIEISFFTLRRIIAMSLQHLANTTQVGISDS